MSIKHVQVVPLKVRDQEAARAWYTEKLGLEVGDDFTQPDGFRWLTVKVPGAEAPEIVLMQAEEGETLDVGRSGGFAFHSDDCRATVAQLKARGLEFVEEATDQFYGVQAVFNDLDGYTHVIVQPKPYQA